MNKIFVLGQEYHVHTVPSVGDEFHVDGIHLKVVRRVQRLSDSREETWWIYTQLLVAE